MSDALLAPVAPMNWEIPNFERHEFFGKRHRYALLIPVLNEGDRIRTQLRRMQTIAQEIDTVIVDGGSTDGATEIEAMRHAGLRALLVKTGPGKLSAQMRVGLAYCLHEGYSGVVLMDGNNKDNPDDVRTFMRSLAEGYDHIQGSRFVAGGTMKNNPVSRVLAIKFLHAPLVSWASGFNYTDTTNGFRAYSARLLLDPRVQPFRDIFSAYELHYYLAIRAAQLGFKVIEVPVERTYPEDGSVPTKISKFRGSYQILKTLGMACLHRFDPKGET